MSQLPYPFRSHRYPLPPPDTHISPSSLHTHQGFLVTSHVHSAPTWAQRMHMLEMAISRCQPAIDKEYSPSLHTAHWAGLHPRPLPCCLSGNPLHHLLPLHVVSLHPCHLHCPLCITSPLLLLSLLLRLELDSLLLSLAPATLLGLHVHCVVVIIAHHPEFRHHDSGPVLLGNGGSGLLGGRHDNSESRVDGQRVSRPQTYICFCFKVRQ